VSPAGVVSPGGNRVGPWRVPRVPAALPHVDDAPPELVQEARDPRGQGLIPDAALGDPVEEALGIAEPLVRDPSMTSFSHGS
jgi:hypothetical protein